MRTFIAIDIPDEIREGIRSLVEELKKDLKPSPLNLRWSRPEGLHITLKFLGEIPAVKVEQVMRSLASLHLPTDIRAAIRGAGYFPTEATPRVIWLRIEAGPELAEMAGLVERTLEPLGFAKEKRPFSPHLTLARVGSPGKVGALQALLRSRQPLEFGSFTAKDFFLYESKLTPGGSIYTKISQFSVVSPA
jgi:RNA 2',3'-cyclic 3'-phosphodiesterase